jgi:hypothetical protein
MEAIGASRVFLRLTGERKAKFFAWESSRPNRLRSVNEIEVMPRNRKHYRLNDSRVAEVAWNKSKSLEVWMVKWMDKLEETQWKFSPALHK